VVIRGEGANLIYLEDKTKKVSAMVETIAGTFVTG